LKLLGVPSKKEIMGEDCYNFITKKEIQKVKIIKAIVTIGFFIFYSSIACA